MARVAAIVFVVAVLFTLSGVTISSALATEPGRTTFATEIEAEKPSLLFTERIGLELSLDWDSATWEISSSDSDAVNTRRFSGSAWTFGATAFYGISQQLDLRASMKFFPLQDEASETDLVRLGLGTKLRFNTGSDLEPYAVILGSYFLSIGAEERGEKARSVGSIDGTFGLVVELGAGYLMTDAFSIHASGHYELLIREAETRVDGRSGEYTFSSVGFGIGCAFYF